MIRVSTREDWGCGPVPEDDNVDPRGVTWHYPGPGRFRFADHAQCLRQVRAWHWQHVGRRSRMLEYGGIVCQHGYYIEGRSRWSKMISRPGSNGSYAANSVRVTAQFMAGTDDAPPSDYEIDLMAEVTAHFREQGAGRIVDGHRDHYATACPGEPIYRSLGEIARRATANNFGKDWLDAMTKEELAEVVERAVWGSRMKVWNGSPLNSADDGTRAAGSLLLASAHYGMTAAQRSGALGGALRKAVLEILAGKVSAEDLDAIEERFEKVLADAVVQVEILTEGEGGR